LPSAKWVRTSSSRVDSGPAPREPATSRGCLARSEGRILLQPAFAIEPVDTTAAGDTFCGTLVASLARGQALQQALLGASAASALACTRLGAQASIPDHAEVAALLADAARVPAADAHAALATACAL